MRSASFAAMLITGTATLLASAATGALGLFMWALALNGFMGRENAVNASLAAFVILAVLSAAAVVALSVLTVRRLAERRRWNRAVAVLFSVVTFATAAAILHTGCVIASALVASALSTKI